MPFSLGDRTVNFSFTDSLNLITYFFQPKQRPFQSVFQQRAVGQTHFKPPGPHDAKWKQIKLRGRMMRRTSWVARRSFTAQFAVIRQEFAARNEKIFSNASSASSVGFPIGAVSVATGSCFGTAISQPGHTEGFFIRDTGKMVQSRSRSFDCGRYLRIKHQVRRHMPRTQTQSWPQGFWCRSSRY